MLTDAYKYKISPDDLVCLDDLQSSHPVKVDLVYAQKDHPDNIFKTNIYKPDAKMWGHRLLVDIVLRAADICFHQKKWIFELKDFLRTTDSQGKMLETDIVKRNPQWLEEPGRLLSPPGKGGHPRAMAVDIILLDQNGDAVDMGTTFDYLTEDRQNNPAARNYTDFSEQVLESRRFLEDCMMQAAREQGHDLLPLPQEWWDFRFLPDFTAQYQPLSDHDLPADMRIVAE